MSIATQITRLNNNIDNMKETKTQIKEAINNDFDIIANEPIEDYAELIEDGLELYKDYIPYVETNQATEITVNDAIKYNRNKMELFGNTEQVEKILPEEYTQVDYIQSYGQEYIDTGVNADSNLRTIIDMTYDDPTSSNQNVGAINMGKSQVRYHILPQNGFFKIYIQNTTYAVNTIAIDTNRHLYDIDVPNRIIQVDENEYNINNQNFDTELNFWLFGRNSDSTIYKSKTKIYRAKMYISGVLVRDFIPCYRNLDNEIGLYDIVNNVFYTNQGTGAFTYGSIMTLPNPEYPQDIHVVTDNNTLEVQGKNLFDKNNITIINAFVSAQKKLVINNGKDKTLYMKIQPNTTYTVSKQSGSRFGLGVSNKILKNNEVFDNIKINYIATNLTISSGEKDNYLYIYFYKNDDDTVSIDEMLSTIQVEQGSTATDYVPYYHADYPINLGSLELCKIGDYQDTIFKNVVGDENYNAELESGAWYKKKTINKKVFDGTENWNRYTNATRGTGFYIAILDGISGSPCLCDKFTNDNVHNIWVGAVGTFRISDILNAGFKVAGSGEDAETLEDWKSKLSSDNLILYYPFATPTSTQITDETLIAQLDTIYEHLQLAKGTNHITITANDLKPYMKLSYKNLDNNE